jgi:YVTN family beta-propeller protein
VVFVAQGTYLRVIDVTTRTIRRTWNLGALWPELTKLRGLEAARPVSVRNLPNSPTTAFYLHAAATITLPGGNTESWYLVLDQERLNCLGSGCLNPMVDRGRLGPTEPSSRFAIDVSLLQERSGDVVQRAWYTERVNASPLISRAYLVQRPYLLSSGAHWSVARTEASTYTTAGNFPPTIRVGTAYDREFAVWPRTETSPAAAGNDADTFQFTNLLGPVSGGCLGIGLTGGALTVSGLGAGSLDTWAITLPALPLDVPAQVIRFRSGGGGVLSSFNAGEDPTDIDLLDLIRPRKVFVVNHGSDSLTVLRTNTNTVVTVPLGGAALGLSDTCQTCPIAGAMAQSSCAITQLSKSKTDQDGDGTKDDLLVSWETNQYCAPGQVWNVDCSCAAANAADCPADCPASGANDAVAGDAGQYTSDCGGVLENPDTGSKWEELGPIAGNSFVHQGVADLKGVLSYTVTPDGAP